MQNTIFYQTKYGHHFCKKEVFNEEMQVIRKKEKLLGEREFTQLLEGSWDEVKKKIILILNQE